MTTQKKPFHRHELTNDIQRAFLADIADRGALAGDSLEIGKLYHCRTKTHSDPKYFWYRIGFSQDAHAFIGTFGSFDPKDKGSCIYPVYDEELTPEQQRRQAEAEEQRRQDAAKREQERQEQAKKDAATLARIAEDTAALAARILAAGSDILPECLERKRLPLVSPGKGIYGRDLIKLLPSSQYYIKQQAMKIKNFPSRVFGLYPAYGKNGELCNIQINLPEKIFFRPDDKKPDDKLFLKGKGTKKGAFLTLTPLSDIPNGSELLICEGYAKAIPLHLCGKFPVIAFDAGNIKNVADYFAPSVYANKADWKEKRRAHTYPRQFTVIHAADNDETGMNTAKELSRRGVASVFPIYPGCKDFDDLFRAAGLEEVKRQAETPRDLSGKYYAITQNQFVSDLKLTYADGVSHLITDTGNGKTQETCRYAEENPAEMTILITPTNGIAETTARKLKRDGKPFQLVMGKLAGTHDLTVTQDYQYDVCGLTITTLAKFAEKFDFSRCLYPVVMFCDESHQFSEDIYRQFDILRLYQMIPQAKKAILMTATPHFHHANGLQAAPKIYIEKAGKSKTRCRLLWYRQELATIKHFADKGRIIVEMNSRNGMKQAAKWLQKQGFSGVFTLSSDDKQARSYIYQYIMENECLPPECRILITTKIFETGLNIYDNDIKSVLMFPVKPLNAPRRAERIPTPHQLKQLANRTRNAAPDVFYCLPECHKPKEQEREAAFYGESHYKRLKMRYLYEQSEYKDIIRSEGFDIAKIRFDQEMREGAIVPLTFEGERPEISVTALDMGVCEAYTATLLNIPFLRQELNRNGLEFDGEISLDDLTAASTLSEREHADFKDAAKETRAEEDAVFLDEVVELVQLTDKELDLSESKHAPKMAFFREMTDNTQDAAALLLAVGREQRAFSTLKSQLTTRKAIVQRMRKPATRSKRRIKAADSIFKFFSKGEFTGKEASRFLTDVFKDDDVLRHEVDITDDGGQEMKEKRAIAICRKFGEIKTRHTERGNVYRLSERDPIKTLWKEILNKTPLESPAFKQWIFGKSKINNSESKNPIAVSKPADTLKNNSPYRDLKSNVSGITPALEYIADSEKWWLESA